MKGKTEAKRTCAECGKVFSCTNRRWELDGKCQATDGIVDAKGEGCKCRSCLMMVKLRELRHGWTWKDTDDHIFLRCWNLKGKKLEELREITRMVI